MDLIFSHYYSVMHIQCITLGLVCQVPRTMWGFVYVFSITRAAASVLYCVGWFF